MTRVLAVLCLIAALPAVAAEVPKGVKVVQEPDKVIVRKRTVVDFEGRSGRAPNAHVATDVNAPAFLALLIERYASLG